MYERVYLKTLKNQTSEFTELDVPDWMTRLNEQLTNQPFDLQTTSQR